MHSQLLLLPEPVQAKVQAELRPGEEIRWVGQPVPEVSKLVLLYFMIAGVAGTAFMIFWISDAAGFADPWNERGPEGFRIFRTIFALLGLPGLAAALAMVLAPLWLPRQIRKTARNSAYVITDTRAIVFDGGYRSGGIGALAAGVLAMVQKGVKIRSFAPDQLRRIERIERADDRGDLVFDRISWRDHEGDEQTTLVGFFSIPEVRHVAGYLNELAQQANPQNKRAAER